MVLFCISEVIYDEIDESRLESIKSVGSRDVSEGDVTATPSSSAQTVMRSAKTGDGKRVQMPQPKFNTTSKKKEKIFKRTQMKTHTLDVYDDNETTEPSKGKDEISETKHDSCRMVLVKGITSDMSKDALELFFENRKKSGGGEIENTTIDLKKGEAVIEFKSSKGNLTFSF